MSKRMTESQIVAILKEAVIPVAERKVWAKELQVEHDISIAMSCDVVGMSRNAFYYRPKVIEDSTIINALTQLIDRHPRWGFPKCFKRLRALGHDWNHKRVYRVYTAMKLNLRLKVKTRLPTRHPEPLATLAEFSSSWSMTL